jgi:hypoxanthine-guanine phosphoribosyltransferase
MLIDEIREKDETIKKLNDLLYEKEKRICNMTTLLKY